MQRSFMLHYQEASTFFATKNIWRKKGHLTNTTKPTTEEEEEYLVHVFMFLLFFFNYTMNNECFIWSVQDNYIYIVL